MWSLMIGLGILLYTLKNVDREISQEVTELKYSRKFDPLYIEIGKFYDIDPELLKAHAIVESGENPLAEGPTNDYGLMQIVYPQKLTSVVNWYQASKEKLLNDVKYNIDVAAQIMKWNHTKFPFEKAIAIYNNWGARNDPDMGPFRNQDYVDKVLHVYSSLLGSNYFPTEVKHTWE